MYHPAFILRTPTLEMRRMYEEDFRKIPALLNAARAKRAAALAQTAALQTAAARLDQLPLL
jgi:hypothetical protein